MATPRILSRLPLVLTAVAATLAVPLAARASDGHFFAFAEAGTAERPLVAAISDRGIIFIGADHAPYRAFHYTPQPPDGGNGSAIWLENIDADREDEFVGSGSPSFVIDNTSDPMWGVPGGCEDFFLGDFVETDLLEVFCRNGRAVNVWSYDGQPYYEWEGRGFNIETCYMDDYDSDGKKEVGCNLSSGEHLMFDLAFDAPETREGEVAPGDVGTVDPTSGSRLVHNERDVRSGNGAFRLNFAGGEVQITQDTNLLGSVRVPATELYSAFAADLDRDGNVEIYLGGTDEIYVTSTAGVLLATVPGNPNSYSRDVSVTVRSATANGLQDATRETTRTALETNLEAVSRCYRDRLGSDQFTRVGEMLWELTIDGSGRVSSSNRRHSSLANEGLESCVQNALEAISFSPATGDSGIVNTTIVFDFVDRP